jgi:hypothetical protein
VSVKFHIKLSTTCAPIRASSTSKQKKTRKAKAKASIELGIQTNTGLSVHLGSSNGFRRNSGSSRSGELSAVLSESAVAMRGALTLAPAAGGDCGTSDIGRFGNRPSLLKSTPPGVPGVVALAPAIVGERDRAGGPVEGSTELGGGDTGEVYDGGEGELVSGGGVAGPSACGGDAVFCGATVTEGVVLSLS